MRTDLNKQLCERERIGHRDCYKPFRKLKKFNRADEDGPVGGRESMKHRYGYDDRKQFNENLNPLKGIVRKAVGRKWDKFFSELMKNFDTRSVINQHILEHLYSYIETETFLDEDGNVMVRGRYRQNAEPIKGSNTEIFVDPRDGIIKRNKWAKSYKAIQRERDAQAARDELKVKRVVDEHNVLRLVDGVWFHFTLKELPEGKIVYTRPSCFPADHPFQIGYSSGRTKVWEQLTEYERQRYGAKNFVGENAYDIFEEKTLYRHGSQVHTAFGGYVNRRGMGIMYHVSKQSASHKMLKDAGII